MKTTPRRPWVLLLLITAIALIIAPGAPAAPKARLLRAESLYGSNDGPAFLIISLTDQFDVPLCPKVNGQLANSCEDMGTQTLILKIGTFIAGYDVFDTRYVGEDLSAIPLDNLPIDPATGLPIEPESLNLNDATVVGSFRTMSGDAHMVTPTPDPIDPIVQEAFFNASGFIEDAQMAGTLGEFPTTVELAYFVYENQLGVGAEFQAILDSLYVTNMKLNCTTCQAEGELFPHEPDSDKLFNFRIAFNTNNGEFEKLEVCLPISIDIKPGSYPNSVNVGSEGVLPVAVLSGAHFDAPGEVDEATVNILGVYPAHGGAHSYEDVNDDGLLDVIFHFSTPDLYAAGADETITQLELRGNLLVNGMCMEGFDSVRVVPPSK